MKNLSLAALLALSGFSAAGAQVPCSIDATGQAKNLLNFHMGEGFEDRIALAPPRPLPSIKNPANPRQTFRVVEVTGFVAPHGEYRMRFIYYLLSGECVLMGQEILELSNL